MRIEIEMERVESESTTLAFSFSALRGVSFVSVAAVVVVEGCEEEEEETSVAAAAVAGLKSRRDCAGRRQPHNAGQGEAAGNVTVALEVTGAEGGNGRSGIRAPKPASPPPPAAPPGGLGLIFQLLVLLCTRSHVSPHPHSSIHSVLSFGPKRDGGPLPERSRSRPVTEVGSLFASGVLIGVRQHRFATTRSPRRPLRRGAVLHRQQQVHFPRSPIPTERTSAPTLPFSSLSPSLPFTHSHELSRGRTRRPRRRSFPPSPLSRTITAECHSGALTPLHSRWDSTRSGGRDRGGLPYFEQPR